VTGSEVSPIPKEARPYQGVTAGLVTRFVANIVDALVVAAAALGCYVGLAGFLFLLDPRSFEFPETSLLLSLTTTLFLATVYFTIAWWLVGRTYGGHVMGLRVTGRKGQRLGPVRAWARAVFCVFFPIGLLWCAVSPRRRSVQDVVLGTSVIYDWADGRTGDSTPAGVSRPEGPPIIPPGGH
jgi:uncharacterized RDD family membrane protein YckC